MMHTGDTGDIWQVTTTIDIPTYKPNVAELRRKWSAIDWPNEIQWVSVSVNRVTDIESMKVSGALF